MKLVLWFAAAREQRRAQAVEVSVDHVKIGPEDNTCSTVVRRIDVRRSCAKRKQAWVLRHDVFVPKVGVINERANPLLFSGQRAELVAVGLA